MTGTKGKHGLLFNDTTGRKRVRINTETGHTAHLSDVHKKVNIESRGGQTIVIDDAANTITVESHGDHRVAYYRLKVGTVPRPQTGM